jgi:hypothetical protein
VALIPSRSGENCWGRSCVVIAFPSHLVVMGELRRSDDDQYGYFFTRNDRSGSLKRYASPESESLTGEVPDWLARDHEDAGQAKPSGLLLLKF